MRLRFGDCSFDLETGELLRGGRPALLSRRASTLLALLLESRPRPVPREELRSRLWPEAPPSQGALTALVLELRGAVEEKGGKEVIQKTSGPDGYAFALEALEDRRPQVPGIGYRFRLFWDDREIPLEEGDNVIGRDYDANVRVDDAKVSRRHARIRIEGDQALLEDLASSNGTFHNGEKIREPTGLADGDEISVGRVHLIFRSAPPTGR